MLTPTYGATVLLPQDGTTTSNMQEAAITPLIASVSAETWLCLTADKLDALSPCQIMPLADLSGFILSGADESSLAVYQRAGVEVISV